MTQEAIIEAVVAERAAQDFKWGEQNHPDVDTSARSNHSMLLRPDLFKRKVDQAATDGLLTWTDILLEELSEAVAEAAKEDLVALKEELIQVTAVAVAWIEAIERRSGE